MLGAVIGIASEVHRRNLLPEVTGALFAAPSPGAWERSFPAQALPCEFYV